MNKESQFNTAWAWMERIADTQKQSNQFQFDRDYMNWGKAIEILYKEVYSKCNDKEDVEAEQLITEMNQCINQSRSKNKSIIQDESRVYNACWKADKFVRKLMEKHKLTSKDEANPYGAAFGG